MKPTPFQVDSSTSQIEGPGWCLEVDPEGEGERLDRFIARRLPRVSRSRAARLEVWRIDQRGKAQSRLKKSLKVRAGERLWVKRPPPEEDLLTLSEPTIIEKTEEFIVVNKPPGWVAHPTASRYESAITTWLKKNGLNAQPAHRLDAETSGVLLCVRNSHLESAVNKLFIEHQVQKEYLAITRILPEGKRFVDSGLRSWSERRPLGFDLKSAVGIKMGDGSLASHTEFELLESWFCSHQQEFRGLIKARPLSGRQHQIRVHLSLAGFPLIGDKLYGLDESYFLRSLDGELTEEDLDRLGHKRQALHAERLVLPWHGSLLEWFSPLPEDLRGLRPNGSSLK